jgi:hypothetical protein
MKNIGFFEKYKLYRNFKKQIKSAKSMFQTNYNVRIDNVNRLYTVVNIPVENFEPRYNTRTSDINIVSEKFLKKFLFDMSKELDNLGLRELYSVYKIEKVDKYAYLVVIGFSLFKTDELMTKIYLRYIPITLVIGLISYLTYLLI